MMAGLDGINNQIHPGEAMDKDLYDLPPEEEAEIPQVAFSLDQALEELDKDREFLKAGDRLRLATNPIEFDLYYSC
jgi:glutamine synthetase